MDIIFNIDFEAEEVHAIVDNSIKVRMFKDGESYKFKNFEKLDDDVLQRKLKQICKLLLSLEDE